MAIVIKVNAPLDTSVIHLVSNVTILIWKVVLQELMPVFPVIRVYVIISAAKLFNKISID